MAEPLVLKHAPTDPAGRVLYAISRAFAIAGGLVLVALTIMSLVSIAGRAMLSMPLPGDYELVQVGCAIAVSAFLPLTQMRGGHVIVDFFTVNARPAVRAALDSLGALLLAVCAGVLAWRLGAGAIALEEANDQTTILALPTWIPVAIMVPCFALFAATGLHAAWSHWSARGGDEAPPAGGAG
ncbi:hypothetical protein BURK1_02968 [Burkholderiales bacterium]|nr:hypothetical protein BURK1_02968 [Burkholderiales bacterium]